MNQPKRPVEPRYCIYCGGSDMGYNAKCCRRSECQTRLAVDRQRRHLARKLPVMRCGDCDIPLGRLAHQQGGRVFYCQPCAKRIRREDTAMRHVLKKGRAKNGP